MWGWRSNAGGMAEVLLSLGGNLGDPVATIEAALDRLAAEGAAVTARSRFFRTPPWGRTDQPAFVNLCAGLRTDLDPRALLGAIHRIERGLGRTRDLKWGPRPIDIDILTYDDVVLDEPGLTIPHPHMTERAFVLVPLAEIAPGRMVAGRSVADWAAVCDATGIVPIELFPIEGNGEGSGHVRKSPAQG